MRHLQSTFQYLDERHISHSSIACHGDSKAQDGLALAGIYDYPRSAFVKEGDAKQCGSTWSL